MAGKASHADDLLELIKTHRPDVVLLMIQNAAGRHGTLLSRLSDFAERAPVLVVTDDLNPALHAEVSSWGPGASS
jgi:DNA-binding NarL/FixJ family response regulator